MNDVVGRMESTAAAAVVSAAASIPATAINDLSVQLTDLTADSIVATIQARFTAGGTAIYTNVGPILLALNPYGPVPIYDAKYFAAYHAVRVVCGVCGLIGLDPVTLI